MQGSRVAGGAGARREGKGGEAPGRARSQRFIPGINSVFLALMNGRHSLGKKASFVTDALRHSRETLVQAGLITTKSEWQDVVFAH